MRAKSEGLTVWESVDAASVGQAEALPHEAVHVELSAGPEAKAEKQIDGNSLFDFAVAAETVRTRIGRMDAWMVLNDGGVLHVPVPVLL